MAERKGFAAVALLRLGRPEKVWPLLRNSLDESVRSHVIHWCAPLRVEPEVIARHWDEEGDQREIGTFLFNCFDEYSTPGTFKFDPCLPDFVKKFDVMLCRTTRIPNLQARAMVIAKVG